MVCVIKHIPVLTKDTLREALQITHVHNNQAFAAPSTSEGLINFVNELGYPKLAKNLSNVVTNDLFQLWRALLTINNLCLTGKTSGFERPRKKRATLIVIPSIRFTKLIIHHLQRSAKGTKREVFGMPIPGSLITEEIQEASYYREYLAKHNLHPLQHQPNHRKISASRPYKHLTSLPEQRNPKYGWVSKKHTLKNVAASKAEEVPAMEPQVAAEDTYLQKALEESMKIAYALPRGLLPPVVIKEPESRKYQPLPEVPGKGKAKVVEEQVAHDLLSLQKHKKTSLTDQYIFQRHVSEPTGSSGHDESPYDLLEQSDSEEELEKVVLEVDEGGQDKGQARPNPGVQAEDQTGTDAGAQDEGQAGSNPDETFEGQAGQTLVILELRPESPKVHQQSKATTTDTTTTTTTTTLPPPQAQQQSTAKAMMVKGISELEHIMANLIQVNKDMDARLDKHRARLYTLEQLDIPQQVSIAVSEVVTVAVDWAMQAPLQNRFRDLSEADMKEILHQRMWETKSYKSHEDHMQLFEALEKSMNRVYPAELAQDLAQARKKKKKSRESPKLPPGSPSHQPPPHPPSAGLSGPSGAPGAFRSSQVPPPPLIYIKSYIIFLSKLTQN
nr:hypothetical protein [Tanacetum cinerariifolium]